jgi:hypothetical protein
MGENPYRAEGLENPFEDVEGVEVIGNLSSTFSSEY